MLKLFLKYFRFANEIDFWANAGCGVAGRLLRTHQDLWVDAERSASSLM